jgi:hypothetical protein
MERELESRSETIRIECLKEARDLKEDEIAIRLKKKLEKEIRSEL